MSEVFSPNTVMVEMVHLHGVSRVENVYHVLTPGVPTSADLDAIFTVFDTWERNVARLQRSSQTQWVAYTLKSIHAAGGVIKEASVTPAPVGGGQGHASWPQVTLAIRWGTGLAGRSYRGRTFHIGFLTVWVDHNGIVNPDAVTQLVTCYNNLRTSLTTAGYPLVVCSKYSGVELVSGYRRAIPRPVGITTLITTVKADGFIDSQRRRLTKPSV